MSVTLQRIPVRDLRSEREEIPNCYICLGTLEEGSVVAHEGAADARHPLHEKCLKRMVDDAQQTGRQVRCGHCRRSVSNAKNFLSLSGRVSQFIATERQKTLAGIALGFILPRGLSYLNVNVIQDKSIGESWRVLISMVAEFYSAAFGHLMLTERIIHLKPFVLTVGMTAIGIGINRGLSEGISAAVMPLLGASLTWWRAMREEPAHRY